MFGTCRDDFGPDLLTTGTLSPPGRWPVEERDVFIALTLIFQACHTRTCSFINHRDIRKAALPPTVATAPADEISPAPLVAVYISRARGTVWGVNRDFLMGSPYANESTEFVREKM